MTFYVYILVDPEEPNHVRYVGYSTNVNRRFDEHIQDASKNLEDNTPKLAWIRKLIHKSILPVISIIDKTDSHEEIQQRERFWIGEHHRNGHRLTNMTAGGDGGKPNAEVLRKISRKSKAYWATLDADTRKTKLRRATEATSIETRLANLAKAHTAINLPENKAKQSKATGEANRNRMWDAAARKRASDGAIRRFQDPNQHKKWSVEKRASMSAHKKAWWDARRRQARLGVQNG